MTTKTILMLSAKRCGSTAVFKMFQNHPDVGVCYYDKNIDNWEPNFWNLAAEAINGNTKHLKKYGYSIPQLDLSIRIISFFKELFPNIISIFRRILGFYYGKYFLKK